MNKHTQKVNDHIEFLLDMSKAHLLKAMNTPLETLTNEEISKRYMDIANELSELYHFYENN